MTALEGYTPISTEKITLDDDTVRQLTWPDFANAATVSSYGGFSLYSVVEADPPTEVFGRPIPNGEEVVLISQTWIKNFQIIRAEAAETYVYVTYYRNG